MIESNFEYKNEKREEIVEKALSGFDFEGSFRDVIRMAYNRGWSDGQRYLLSKADAILRSGEQEDTKTP